MFAKVTVNTQGINIGDIFDYNIPDEMLNFIKIGSRVLVDFGARKVLGFVVEITNVTTYKGAIRDIIQVLDYENELNEEHIMLAKKISYDTKTPLCVCLEAMIPSFLKSKFKKFLVIKNYDKLDPHIISYFNDKKKICLDNNIIMKFPKIKKEIENGNLALEHDIYTYGKKKKIKEYYLNPSCENIYSQFTGVKRNIVLFIKNKTKATFEQLREYVGCSNAIVNNLEKQEILLTKFKELEDDYEKDTKNLKRVEYDFQGNLLIKKYEQSNNNYFLLNTSSFDFAFKFYLDVCIENILNNKKVMITTPTLVSFYNILYYLKRNLPGVNILSLSNDLGNSEYYDTYMKIKKGYFDVFITTKIGIFTPFNDIGLIICIDESNFNYISEATPKANLVEVLKHRAQIHKAKMIIHSFPLSIESYYKYFLSEYTMLKYEVNQSSDVTLVNMQDEVLCNHPIISRTLEAQIQKTLDQNKQVMLILNSTGYSNILKCKKCGDICTCEKCNIPLTYYKDKNEYKCKYCGRVLNSIKCKCGGSDYAMFGMGLEKVKETLDQMFPLENILQVDSMSLREYEDYQNIVCKIESGEASIIIGTSNLLQLKTFANVGLTSLISIDSILNHSDYKASFQAYSLITNCLFSDKLIIQGFDLDHFSIKYAINNDFNNFYNEEIKRREEFNYPPFYEVNKLLVTGDYSNMYYFSNYFKKVYMTKTKKTDMVLGPVYVKLRKGVQLIIKSNDYDTLYKLIDEVSNKFKDKNIQISFERYTRYL